MAKMSRKGTLRKKNWGKDRKAEARPRKKAKGGNEKAHKEPSALIDSIPPEDKA